MVWDRRNHPVHPLVEVAFGMTGQEKTLATSQIQPRLESYKIKANGGVVPGVGQRGISHIKHIKQCQAYIFERLIPKGNPGPVGSGNFTTDPQMSVVRSSSRG